MSGTQIAWTAEICKCRGMAALKRSRFDKNKLSWK